MKTLKLISIVLFLSLASCRSREMSFGRSKTSETAKEKISLNERHSESVNGVRVVEMMDSSKLFVGMRIYPLDTFSLNMNDGFRGRARVVEYWGVEERLREGKDRSVVVGKKEYKSGYINEMERRKDEVLKSREVSNKRLRAMWWAVVLLMGVFVFWWGSRKARLF